MLGVGGKDRFLGLPTDFEFDIPASLSVPASSVMNASNDF